MAVQPCVPAVMTDTHKSMCTWLQGVSGVSMSNRTEKLDKYPCARGQRAPFMSQWGCDIYPGGHREAVQLIRNHSAVASPRGWASEPHTPKCTPQAAQFRAPHDRLRGLWAHLRSSNPQRSHLQRGMPHTTEAHPSGNAWREVHKGAAHQHQASVHGGGASEAGGGNPLGVIRGHAPSMEAPHQIPARHLGPWRRFVAPASTPDHHQGCGNQPHPHQEAPQ